MNKLLVLVSMLFLFSGCGTAVERSEFLKHDSHYANCEHMIYSWTGYKKPTNETLKKSNEQGWWGIPIEGK